jgi:hypothetical protein
MTLPKVSQNILGHDIAKSIQKYPRPWHKLQVTFNPSFGHNLCFKYQNGSCEPILDNYVLKFFQWYKKVFNQMNFNPWNCFMKIWESMGSPTPKVGVHLGVWGLIPLHSPTLLGVWHVTPGLHSWPAPSQALALVASPRLGLWQSIYGQFVVLFTWVVFIGLINTIWSMPSTLVVVVGSVELKFFIVETPCDLPPNFVTDPICIPFLTTSMLGVTTDYNPMVVILARSNWITPTPTCCFQVPTTLTLLVEMCCCEINDVPFYSYPLVFTVVQYVDVSTLLGFCSWSKYMNEFVNSMVPIINSMPLNLF